MTVRVRPAPPRIAGNNIRPMVPTRPVYKLNNQALRDWRPPVPQPLSPAPLLSLPKLALLALQALGAWAWGLLNGRRSTPGEEGYTGPTGNDVVPGGVVTGAGASGQTMRPYFNTPAALVTTPVPANSSVSYWHEINPDFGPNGYVFKYQWKLEDGSSGTGAVASMSSGNQLAFGVTPEGSFSPEFLGFFSDSTGELYPSVPVGPPAPLVPAIAPEPMTVTPDQYPEPLPPLPLPYPAPSPQVQPQPATEPQTLPAPSPLVPITPGPVAPPVVRPAVPVTPVQPKVPAPTQTNNGIVVQPLPQPVPTTPKDAIFPVPGGLPVTGQAIPPTLPAIAQEVGRIEQKIDRMVNPKPGQWGDVPDASDLLQDLAGRILEAIITLNAGTTYTMDSPCEVDEETGAMLPPVEVEAPGSINAFGLIVNRLDALAVLLQVHKNLKQPNCKPKQPTGEFVTVNFEEIN